MTEPTARKPPVVLIIDAQEWSSRSLDSILAPNGFAVMRAHTGRVALELVRSHSPDLIIIDADLPDTTGYELCRTLRDDPALGARMPILISMSEPGGRKDRMQALRAGAWDVIAGPVDAEELVMRLGTFARAKIEADRFRDAGLVDDITGLYNVVGLQRRAKELGDWAYRSERGLACVIFSPDLAPEDEADPGIVRALADALKEAGRSSDAIGRFGAAEFAVIAVTSGSDGAERLAQRLAESLRKNGVKVRAGYDAVENARDNPTPARDLLRNATMAARQARGNGSPGWLRPYHVNGS